MSNAFWCQISRLGWDLQVRGKTYLAVACAVDMLERNEIERILLVRPAVEAGEKLGFLPGDLTQKSTLICARCMMRFTKCWGLRK